VTKCMESNFVVSTNKVFGTTDFMANDLIAIFAENVPVAKPLSHKELFTINKFNKMDSKWTSDSVCCLNDGFGG